MRISDWSSDVCSSDLAGGVGRDGGRHLLGAGGEACEEGKGEERLAHQWLLAVNSTPRPVSTTIPTTNSTTRRGIGCSRRSEGHTSELQSIMRISYAVFCLKNKTISTLNITYMII